MITNITFGVNSGMLEQRDHRVRGRGRPCRIRGGRGRPRSTQTGTVSKGEGIREDTYLLVMMPKSL